MIPHMIAPGETIGILGGGQLGRMLAMAAAQLGYRAHVYAPEADSIAAEVCGGFTCAGWYDAEALAKFARDCAVITYEFENVPVAPLVALGDARVLPNLHALEIAQDRLAEKRCAESLGGGAGGLCRSRFASRSRRGDRENRRAGHPENPPRRL